MRVATVREFRDNATAMMRSRQPVVVTRHGAVAGVFFPQPLTDLPLEFKRRIFAMLSEDFGRRLRKAGISEKEIQADFEERRRKNRPPRGGR